MSSFAGYCGDCGKPVMHKTFFGTLHVCLSTEERAYKAMLAQQQSVSGIRRLAQRLPQILEPAGTHTKNANGRDGI